MSRLVARVVRSHISDRRYLQLDMTSRTMEKILVVGAGLTGAATSSFVARDAPKHVNIDIWDKSGGVGGRMSTSRSTKDDHCSVDLGAQYISATPEYYEKHQRLYEDLLKENIISLMQCKIEGDKHSKEGTRHFVTPKGISSVVKYFISNKNVNVRRNHLLEDVTLSNGQWQITSEEGQKDLVDCLVLTMPVPQILQLQGSIRTLIENSPDILRKLEAVQYSSRFAVGLFYNSGTTIDLPWTAKYFYDSPCIRFVSIDNKKRLTDQSAPSVCIHTSVPFSLQHLEEDKDMVGPTILQELKDLVPNLPPHNQVKNHKWRFSQVHKGYEGSPGCVVLHEDPLLILAGDAFIHSNFDGCIESASRTADVILQQMTRDKSKV